MKELDWANLPFGYMKTDYNVRIYYRNEQWGELEVCCDSTTQKIYICTGSIVDRTAISGCGISFQSCTVNQCIITTYYVYNRTGNAIACTLNS